jgi:hypothetical protein
LGGYYEYGLYVLGPPLTPDCVKDVDGLCYGPSDGLPFYWNEQTQWYLDSLYNLNPKFDIAGPSAVDQSQNANARFSDLPMTPCLAGSSSDYEGFFTTLAGVTTPVGTFPADYTPVASFLWNSTYSGSAGSINGVAVSSLGPPAIDGTGNIFNIALVNVTDLPLAMRQQLIQTGAQGISTAPKVDKDAPMTAAFLTGQRGTNGWYTAPVNVTLIATDIDGPSDIAGTTYSVDASTAAAYTGPFRVSGDRTHTIQFGSVDLAGNVETPQPTQTIKIDATPPTVSCSVNPNTLWPPNGKAVAVVVSGGFADVTSGVDPSGATYAVVDEYGQVQPTGGVTLGVGGSYSFAVPLVASRAGNDMDGRTYTIVVRGKDQAGNTGSCSAVVTVPHDQGK